MNRAAAALLLSACGCSEPAAPPAASTPRDDSAAIAHGDTDAAIAQARAALEEVRRQNAVLARPTADLIEALFSEDPIRIGAAVSELVENLPRRVSGR